MVESHYPEMASKVRKVIDRLRAEGLIDGPLVGIGSNEISIVEQRQGERLPSAYVEFLRIMGASAGPRLKFRFMFYPLVLELKAEAQDVIDTYGIIADLDGAVVVACHEGYIYFYTRGEGEDPPVYFLSDGVDREGLVADSFSEFIEVFIRDSW